MFLIKYELSLRFVRRNDEDFFPSFCSVTRRDVALIDLPIGNKRKLRLLQTNT